MASFRVLSWHGIPSQVKVTDETGAVVGRTLPPSFQQEIDRVAMAEGLTGSDDYLEGWQWSEAEARIGSADDVADAIIAEIAAQWPPADRRSSA